MVSPVITGGTAAGRVRGDIRIARTMCRTPTANPTNSSAVTSGDHQLDGEPAVQDPSAERRRVRLPDRETFGDLHRGEERGLQRHEHQGQRDGRRVIDTGGPAPKAARRAASVIATIARSNHTRLDQDRPQRRALVPEPDHCVLAGVGDGVGDPVPDERAHERDPDQRQPTPRSHIATP